ncbi:MAG TPA: SCO family protein, partial [Steroidobacteraceae bacterium]|nr:SCO family protein [Steroidobacteraceae bacterium]
MKRTRQKSGGSGGGFGVCGGRRLAARLAARGAVAATAVIAAMVTAAAFGAAPILSGAALATRTPFTPDTTMGAATPTRTVFIDPPRAIHDFALTNEHGKPVRLSELAGAPVLVYFGFAHCPAICPAALTQLRRLELSYARDLGRTRIVVISVDGERDTPAVLAEWLKPISPTFIGLTGPSKAVHEIAAQFSAPFFKGVVQPSGDYLVEHNSQVFL